MNKKLNSKKGFTLVEVLVAMFCSILILTTITGSLIFIEKMNTQLIDKTSNLYKIRVVEKYIKNNYTEEMTLNVKDGNVYYGSTMIVENSLIVDEGIKFNSEAYDDKYNKINDEDSSSSSVKYIHTTCTITYNEGVEKQFTFIANISSK